MSATTVTLSDIRAHDPCAESWKKLLASLGKTQADDTPVSLTYILDLLGLDDALWALRALPESMDNDVRLLVCDLVEPSLQHTKDPRPAEAVAVARRYARGEATREELDAAGAAAWTTAGAAAWTTARAAARAAAGAAAWAAAGDAARDAVWAAAGFAARAAAWAARDAVWAAAWAARDAVWAAPSAAARMAASASAAQKITLREWIERMEGES